MTINKEHLDILMRHGEPQVTDTWFPYTSAKIGPYYIQSIVVERDGRDYAAAIDALAELVLRHAPAVTVIAGGETRDWDFSNPVAVALDMAHAKLYKEKKPLGASMEGQRVAIVSDLNNQGSSVAEYWHPIILRHGGIPTHAFFYVDRMETGAAVVATLGLERHAVVELVPEAWDHMRERGFLSAAKHENVQAYLADPDGWAERQLMEHPEKLKEMMQGDPDSRRKAMKILNVGYPQLEERLRKII